MDEYSVILKTNTLYTYFYLLFCLFIFQLLSLFPVYPLKTPIHRPPPASTRVFSPPIYPLLSHCPSIHPYWGIEPPQDQEAPLTLMPDKARYAAGAMGPSMCTIWLVV